MSLPLQGAARASHPDDQWVEVTILGDAVPRLMLARDGREVAIARAKDLYVHDRITIHQLERRIDKALHS